MHRTRVRPARTAVVLSLVVWLAVVAGGRVAGALSSHGRSAPMVADRPYVVRTGDTLWSIATSLAPERDPRPVARAIQVANGVEPGSLVPGSVLRIPAVV